MPLIFDLKYHMFTHTPYVALETYAKERPFSLNKILAWKKYLNNTKRTHGGHEIDNIFRKRFMQIHSLMAWHKSHIFSTKVPYVLHNCVPFQRVTTKVNFAWASVLLLPSNVCSNFITFPKLDVSTFYLPYIF